VIGELGEHHAATADLCQRCVDDHTVWRGAGVVAAQHELPSPFMRRLGDVDVNGDGPPEVEDAHHHEKQQPGEQCELDHRLTAGFAAPHQ